MRHRSIWQIPSAGISYLSFRIREPQGKYITMIDGNLECIYGLEASTLFNTGIIKMIRQSGLAAELPFPPLGIIRNKECAR
ncbi:MAG: hypothetical protein K0B87_05740 [Candidatus Syntrophosphaera sp.]|nr:hypothetical protein [Candidatus Syntrophosphaera sp.]